MLGYVIRVSVLLCALAQLDHPLEVWEPGPGSWERQDLEEQALDAVEREGWAWQRVGVVAPRSCGLSSTGRTTPVIFRR